MRKTSSLHKSAKVFKENIEDVLGLTPLQEGLLFHYLESPRSNYYFEQLVLDISGEIDTRHFEAAWNHVVRQNEMLRAVFRWEKVTRPVQVILKDHPVKLITRDLSGKNNDDRDFLFEELKTRDRLETFDLREVPFRVILVKMGDSSHRMIIDSHHILFDGWSSALILEEFFSVYGDLVNDRTTELPHKAAFKEYLKWLRDRDRGEQLQAGYWKEYFKGFEGLNELSVKKNIPDKSNKSKSGRPDSYNIKFTDAEVETVNRFLERHQVTLAGLFYTAWGILLQKYNDTDDVTMGTTVSGRSAPIAGIEHTVGLFINTLPLRVRALAGENCLHLLLRITGELLERREYETTPLVKIREYSPMGAGVRLFDTLFVMENYPFHLQRMQESSGLTIRSYAMSERTHYELTVTVETFEGIGITFGYKPCFDKETAARLADYFKRIVLCVVENPGVPVAAVDILSEEEKQRVLYEFNDTDADFPAEKTVIQLFEEQAARFPDRIAFKGSVRSEREIISISYRKLEEASRRTAFALGKKRVGPGTIAAVMLERSPRLLIYIYAILKAGAAYLPIDTHFPDERKQYIMEDSGAGILLTRDTEIEEMVEQENHEIVGQENHEKVEQASLFPTSFSMNVAYIIYTSGSTGLPKGVMVEHRSLVNRLVWMQKNYRLGSDDIVLHKTPITFDISVWELFWWGIAGASVCFLAPGAEKDPAAIVETVQLERITIMHFVPSMLQSMLQYIEDEGAAPRLRSLRQVFSSGEALSYSQAKRFNRLLFTANRTRLTNLYGPTEATIDVSRFDCSGVSPLHKKIIPIGKPIDNIRLLILDRNWQLAPVGVPGELWIGGVGLARGYINNPSLTAKKFNRTYRSYFYSFYKTGDRVRWLDDGNIEFLGRFDFQVKIRGFRVEPVEIENRLLTHPMVKEAAVTAKETPDGDSGICAYIVSRNADFTVCELKEYLSRRLPYYMVPSHFIALDRLPLTPNGKLDRKSLPGPDSYRPPLKVSYTVPESEMEKKVAALWKEVLKLENVGVNDNFFDLGGHSLHIIRLTGRLKKLFKKEVPVTTLFRCPTIRSLVDQFKGVTGTRSVGHRPAHTLTGNTGTHGPQQYHGREIAVIGIALRFPGAATIEAFWENLVNGVESITFLSSPSPGDSRFVSAKGRLENSHAFDADFFEYTQRESHLMDPQLRLLHPCVWEALANAGYDPLSYKGLIGLYTGALSGYSRYEKISPYIKNHSERLAVGSLTDRDFFSTRIAYKLNLRGPVLTIQTACSTSLVAIDAACRGLLNGDCDIAAAGGVSITHEDEDGYLYQEGLVRSPDGHCRAFDAKAGGTVGGNGAGIVVLKPLSAALTDRDTIYAVIKGSAVNNDGRRKVGFTAPGVEGQADVIRSAFRKSEVSAESITYVEAHGTGTKLGDPVEIEALKAAFDNPERQYCAVGSVKANIGHLDAASGAAGLIKTVLALYHRVIPPTLHFEQPNPSIDFENSPFYVNNRLLPWPGDRSPLRAGVSSFGIGGTNAHVILEEPPREKYQMGRSEVDRRGHLVILSAKKKNTLEVMGRDLAAHIRKNKNIDIGSVAYTLQVGRPTFKYRCVAVVVNAADAVEVLTDPASSRVQFFAADHNQGPAVFMFPGQGSQYVDMGAGLYRHEPLFRQILDLCFEILSSRTGENLKEILYPPGSDAETDTIHHTRYSQPVLFAFEYALARLLMQWGITPRAMIGHSLGEYTAACIAGVFSLEDGLRLVALRGKLMQQMPTGAMLAVSLSRKQLDPLLHGKMSVAAVNGPSSCVVSGPGDDVFQLAESLGKRGIENRMLHTSHAFHSPMMEPVLEEFESAIRTVLLKPPQIPYISNLTGTWITPKEAVDPHYWSTHLRKTVRMFDGLSRLLGDERTLFIEVGPGRVLSTFVHKHPNKKAVHEIVNLIRHPNETIDDLQFLLSRIGRIWGTGFPVDWERFNSHRVCSRIPLPGYPFDERSYHLETDPAPSPQKDQQEDHKEKNDIADWFYIPLWRQTFDAVSYPDTSMHPVRSKEPSTCIVFTDTTPFNHRFTDRLKKMYRTVFQVKKGNKFQRRGKSLFTVHPGTYNHYQRLLKDIVETGIVPPLKIIHLWGTVPSISRSIGTGLEYGFFSLLHLARALADAHVTGPVHFEVITAGMQPVVGDEDLQPVKAAVLGPVKIIPLEYTNTLCRSIDIHLPASPGAVEDRLIENLLIEIQRPFDRPAVAFRGNYRWVQEFESLRIEPSPNPPSLLRPGGVYLITGGFGGMGFTFAGYLARTFKARLILVSRSPLPPGGTLLKKVGELEKLGAEVLSFSCDVSDYAGMKRVVRSAVRRFGSINGVFHTAGIADYGGVIQRRTLSDTLSVLAPKINGTIVLDKILKEIEPVFIVLFSTIGNIAFRQKFGQVAYAGANEFLDAFSYYKHGRSRTRFISINWSDWRERGMAVTAAAHWAETLSLDPRSNDLLENAILPSEGIDAFLRILNQPFPRVAVSPEPLSQKIETGIAAFQVSQGTSRESTHAGKLSVDKNAMQRIGDVITETWQDFLRVETIGIHDNIFDLGASSLDVVQVNARLKEALKRDIPLVAMYTYPTVHSLTRFLEQEDKNGNDNTEFHRVNEQVEGWNRSRRTFNRTLKKIRSTGQGIQGIFK